MRCLTRSKGIVALLSSSVALSVVDGAYDHFQVMGTEEADEEDNFLEELLHHGREELAALSEATYYFDLSMSMSMPSALSPTLPPGPTTPTVPSPTAPTPSPPSGLPTVKTPVPTRPDGSVPTVTKPPVVPPPSTTSTPTTVTPPPNSKGSLSPTPALPCTECPKTVFVCTKDGVILVENANITTTTIPIDVGYLVESNSFVDEFQEDLEARILKSAVIGALQCESGGPVFGPGGSGAEVPMFTSLTGDDCVAEISFCTVMETEFQIIAGAQLNPDTAAFLGYVKLQDDMDGGAFVDDIPILDRVEYLSPLPLLPPISDPVDVPVLTEIDANGETLRLSPWTYGAVLAVCAGGLMALGMWARNRRTRNQRHMQLLEDMSLASGPEA